MTELLDDIHCGGVVVVKWVTRNASFELCRIVRAFGTQIVEFVAKRVAFFKQPKHILRFASRI